MEVVWLRMVVTMSRCDKLMEDEKCRTLYVESTKYRLEVSQNDEP